MKMGKVVNYLTALERKLIKKLNCLNGVCSREKKNTTPKKKKKAFTPRKFINVVITLIKMLWSMYRELEIQGIRPTRSKRSAG